MPAATDRRATAYAIAAAALTVAFQLAGKATRDALFLSTFSVAYLPRIVVTSALLSVGLTLGLTRVMASRGPGRLVPRLFALSGVLLLLEWLLAGPARPAAAIVFYLHFGGLGALLVSAFWALVNERFDPRSARGAIARITTGASIGGLLGGVLPERVGATLTLTTMLPVLAVLHLAAGALVIQLLRATRPQESSSRRTTATRSPGEIIRGSRYLQGIALLVLLTSTVEGLLDYVFKAGATAAVPDGAGLLRLFAAFYTATAILTILAQVFLLGPFLNRIGVARSAGLLPGASSAGALGALLLPGFGPLLVARGLEVVFHNSLFRAAYELLFTPIAPQDKRATKLVLDVGGARLGDIVAGSLVQTALLIGVATAVPLLGVTLAVGLAALWLAQRLHAGYVASLAQNLHRRAADLPLASDDPGATLLQSFGAFDVSLFRDQRLGEELVPHEPGPAAPDPDPAPQSLVSSKPDIVLAALEQGPLAPAQLDDAVHLLAWDAVAPRAVQALIPFAMREPARLTRYLLDPGEDFAVRRRLVRVLAEGSGPEVRDALLRALEDPRFEVRYRAGRALARVLSREPGVTVEADRVIETVLREVAVDRGVWEGRHLIDQSDDDWSPIEAEVVRDRATRSLEHVFTLLALILPADTLRLAYHGLHTGDAHLRGTALEYLESALPERVRDKLWPFLEVERQHQARPLTPEQALRELLASRESIVLALAAARGRVTPAAGS
ncbi:MAG: hypothetical protein U0133_19185 [Gemmatimonadales bacterium]